MTAPLIKRIDEFYVGFKEQHPDDSSIPLAFLTPFDTTKAFEKRKETVDTWARGYGTWDATLRQYVYADTIPSKNIKNEPLAGFKLSKSVKRTGSWNGGNVVWRIEDPRGFEWEIPSENMAQILMQSGMAAGGEFNGRCIIGRIGAANILIPEGTDLWDQMEVDMTTRAKKDAAKIVKDFIKGQWVKLKDGREGWYMGREHLRLASNYKGNGYPIVNQNSADAYHLFAVTTSYGWTTLTAYKTLPVVEVFPNRVLSPSEEAKMMVGDKKQFKFAGAVPVANAYITGIAKV